MNDHDQQVALLTALGWTELYISGSGQCGDEAYLRGVRPGWTERVIVPDLSLDLLHEAEALAYRELAPGWADRYYEALNQITSRSHNALTYNWAWHATKEQRLEAFLKTTGRWVT